MIYADFHSHSKHSTDGKSSLEENILAAIDKGIKILCATEHTDYNNHNCDLPSFIKDNPDFPPEMRASHFVCDTDSYLKNYLELREKYKARIDLRFGMELGLQPDLGDYYKEFAKKYPFDFLIGSSHEAGLIDPYYPEYTKGRTLLEAYRFYFDTERICAKACVDGFDVYGHLDYALRYHCPADFEFRYEEYADILDELLLFLIQNGKGIEINTKGFSYFGTEPNPRLSILKQYRKFGGEIITIGSDAHHCSELRRDFDRAEEILKQCGFDYYTVFKNRKPKFIRL